MIHSIFTGETFQFLVGPGKKRYAVHINALKNISKALGSMMTNGKMVESINGEAELPEIEPLIFEQLLKYAYRGISGLADGLSIGPGTPQEFSCYKCGISVTKQPSTYPFCGPHCQTSCRQLSKQYTYASEYYVHCVKYSCGKQFSNKVPPQFLCREHRDNIQIELHPLVGLEDPDAVTNNSSEQLSILCRPPGLFMSLQYGITGMTHHELKDVFDTGKKDDKEPYLTPFQLAKLYFLADQYDVADLRAISLHLLHRSLSIYKITGKSISDLAGLLRTTYENTPDRGEILLHTNNKLRELVMSFIVDCSGLILKHKYMRSMISSNAAMSSDYLDLKHGRAST